MKKILLFAVVCLFGRNCFAEPPITSLEENKNNSEVLHVEQSTFNAENSKELIKKDEDAIKLYDEQETEKSETNSKVDTFQLFEEVEETAVISNGSVAEYTNKEEIETLQVDIKKILQKAKTADTIGRELSKIFFKTIVFTSFC